MTDEEYMEISDDYSVLSQLDIRDTRVKESVVAYLMWHSGEVLDKGIHRDRQARANRIDALGETAINAFRSPDDVRRDSRRVLATKSILHQATESRKANPNSIVCHLDAEMIMSGAMIPTLNLDGEAFNIVCPPELGEVGFNFRDFDTFRQKYIDLGTYLITDPMTVMHMLEHLQGLFLEKSINNYQQLTTFHTILPHWNIVGAPEHCDRDFETLSSYDTGKVVKIQGQISEAGNTMVVLTKIAYRCRTNLVDEDGNKTDRKCNTINLVPQNAEEGIVVKPHECSACGGKDFIKLDSDKSQSEPVQRMELQDMQISEEPKSMMVELRGNLTDIVTVGSTVEITGILRLSPIGKQSLMNSLYILGQSIRVVSEETHMIHVSDEDEAEILDFVETWTLEERMVELCNAWNGHIKLKDQEEIKYAMMLQAVGSPETEFGHRTAMHIMIAGDPGTAKTLLLQSMLKLRPASRYLDASGATPAGLSAAAEPIEDFYTGKKRWGLRPGIIPLTPKDSVCCIDELNLYKHGFGDINTALESGKVYKTTGPVKGILDAPAAILAGANPMAGDKKKFVTGKGMSFIKQIGMDEPELQRYDLIYVLLDQAEYDRDFDIAMSVMGSGKNTSSAVNLEFVQKYVALSKGINPRVCEEAKLYIAKQHAKKRKSETDEHLRSHRLVPALQRLALATARFDFADEVTLDHVKFAESICAKSLNETDPGLLTGSIDKESRQKNDKVESFVSAFMETQSSLAKLQGIEGKKIKEHLKANNVLFDNNTEFNSAMRRLPFLTASGSKWIYEEA
jgi:DNA replicative helicase MCM subunit Mcm2 (Cdc46/Mcm family)